MPKFDLHDRAMIPAVGRIFVPHIGLSLALVSMPCSVGRGLVSCSRSPPPTGVSDADVLIDDAEAVRASLRCG